MPPVTQNLIIINALCWLATLVLAHAKKDLIDLAGLHFPGTHSFHWFQPITYMFLHDTHSFAHIFFNMFALWMFGMVVENVWGPKKFLFYYIACGIGAGLFQEAAQFCSFYLTVASQYPSLSLAQLPEVARHLGDALNSWTTVGPREPSMPSCWPSV